jgi:hypothetical protein
MSHWCYIYIQRDFYGYHLKDETKQLTDVYIKRMYLKTLLLVLSGTIERFVLHESNAFTFCDLFDTSCQE